MGADGRLSPVELDALLGPADPATAGGSRPQPAPPGRPEPADVLAAGTDRPTWSELTRSWAGRHRVAAVALVLGAAAVSLGTWTVVATRPPPVAAIDVAVLLDTIEPIAPDGGNAAEPVRMSLELRPADPADDVRAVALRGPGLEQPRVWQSGDHVTTANILSCNDIPNLGAPVAYQLTVARTDAYGRVVTGDVAVTGVGTDDAGRQLARACLARAARVLQVAAVGYDADAAAPLRVEVRNPTGHDLYAFGAGAALGTAGAYLHPDRYTAVALPAGSLTTVRLAHDVSDCFARASTYEHEWGAVRDDGYPGGDLGIFVGASPGRDQHLGVTTVVTLDRVQRRAVARAVADPCRRAPRLTYSVGSVAVDPTASSPAVTFTIRASVPAGSIDLRTATAPDSRWLGPGTLEGIARSAVDSSTSARLRWWIGSCHLVQQGGPPTFRADVRYGHQIYPYLLPVWQRTVREAVAGACSGSLATA